MSKRQEALKVIGKEILRLRRLLGLAVLLLCAGTAHAQTATFTWNGSSKNPGVELASIDGFPVDQRFGFAGFINTGYYSGTYLTQLDLPEPGTCSQPINPDGSCSGETFPAFPNNGFFQGGCGAIVWTDKQWGIRADGTPMDGSQAGDSYNIPGTSSCVLWNGSVNVGLTEYHQFIRVRYCVRGYHGTCFQFGYRLVDTEENGIGTVSCVAGSGSYGACGS